MKYIIDPLSNAELMLLELINEQKEISGYDIELLVRERGYRNWADIGTTSIYVSLKKLTKKELVISYLLEEKSGKKGPKPKIFKLTEKGIEVLKEEILQALSFSRERDIRFDLGLAAMPILSDQEVLLALEQRRRFLQANLKKMEYNFQLRGGRSLPIHLIALFDHSAHMIRESIRFTESLIDKL